MKPLKQMDYATWCEKYRPVKNTVTEGAPYDGTMFETHGDDMRRISSMPNVHVWTLVDEDGMKIIPGIRFMARLGYFVTEVSHDDKYDIEVI